MQQYLTLEEAAKYLQMSPDELREMAKKKAIRAFQDRGTWRFRSADVEEMARLRGLGSDAQLQLGEARKPSGKKPVDSDAMGVDLGFDESEEVPIGRERTGGSGPRSGTGKSGPKSPKPGSDSDVRLVGDGKGDIDSEVRFDSPGKGSGKGSGRKAPAGSDSGVRLVPSDPSSDSDVRLEQAGKGSDSGKKKGPSDSDIRLQEAGGKKKGDGGHITEEIDLDAEEAKLSGTRKKPGKPTQVAKPGTPFELSEPPTKSPVGRKKKDSSSDFELIPFDASKSPVELGSGEIPLLEGDEEVSLGGPVGRPTPGNSGINLDPGDSGISLEDGGSDEIVFEDETPRGKPAARTPAPKKGGKAKPPVEEDKDSSSEFELSTDDPSSEKDSSSEFELSMDEESSPGVDSSSEFELSLEDDDSAKGKVEDNSDSEFELTLDDEGGLAVEEDAGDIFEETNFDVPALEDESGSEAVALEDSDTDLESSGSDFEISLDEDSGTAAKSGSQVVALEDQDEADDAAATVARPRKTASKSKAAAKAAALKGDISDEDIPSLDDDSTPSKRRPQPSTLPAEEDEESEEEMPVAAAPAAEWGALPAILLFPTVLVLFLVCIMGYELLRGMWGFHRPSAVGKPVITSIAKMLVDDKLPD